jgi:predicted dehydrogenase
MPTATEQPRRPLRVGLLGYGFMGRAHSYALHRLNGLAGRPDVLVERSVLCGRSRSLSSRAQRQYGWSRSVTDWRELVTDAAVDLVINAAPNALHAAPTLVALEHGKHVLCEKPLARGAEEALGMARAALDAPTVTACGFNYRFMPAIALARDLLQDGSLGEVVHYRSSFLLSTGLCGGLGQWRLDDSTAGSGVLGDLASHHIDLARHLVGEPAQVVGRMQPSRIQGASVDESIQALVTFATGASGIVEASAVAGGHSCTSIVEIDGTRGSLRFDLARLNELALRRAGRTEIVHVTDPSHPFMAHWFPTGHGIGWGDTFVHQLVDVCAAIAEAPSGPSIHADFRDGYRCAEICAAIANSAASGAPVPVTFRDGSG